MDPRESAVVSLGQVHAGAASNVIPAEVFLNGTLRSFTVSVREQIIAEVERALSVARVFGGDYRLEVERGYPPGYSNPKVSGWIERVAIDLVGAQAIHESGAGLYAEDFAYMSAKVPGAMLHLGAAIPDGIKRAHHTPIFDIDERCMPIGAAVLAETTRRFLAGELDKA